MKYNNIEDITKLIKHIMVEENIKQKDIASRTNWSKQTISNILNNRTDNVGINTLKELCDGLNYDLYIDIIKKE